MVTDIEEIEGLQTRLQTNNDISDDDRAVIEELDDALDRRRPQDLSAVRHKKLLRSVIIMSERHGGLADALKDREAAENLKDWIDDEYENEESNRDMRAILNRFGGIVTGPRGDENPPASIGWIPTTYSNSYDPTPDPRDILLWDEDVAPMLQAAQNHRDRALVAAAFDGGFRGGELKNLKVRSCQDHTHGMKLTVEGKQNRRSVLLVPAVEYLTDWLAEHPGDDGTDPLWSKLGTPERISDRMFYKTLDTLADRAGVDKPVTPTNFRKSSAAYLARRNVNQAHIEDHHGWVRGSDAAARYIQVFGEDTDREIARAHGVEVNAADEPTTPEARMCPRCSATVEPHRSFCAECNQAVDREAHALIERAMDILDDSLIKAEDAAAREKLIKTKRGFRDHPDDIDMDAVHELVSSVDAR
jgi:integrase